MYKDKLHCKPENRLVIPTFEAQIQAVDSDYWKLRMAKYAEFDKLETSPYFDCKAETITMTEQDSD